MSQSLMTVSCTLDFNLVVWIFTKFLDEYIGQVSLLLKHKLYFSWYNKYFKLFLCQSQRQIILGLNSTFSPTTVLCTYEFN